MTQITISDFSVMETSAPWSALTAIISSTAPIIRAMKPVRRNLPTNSAATPSKGAINATRASRMRSCIAALTTSDAKTVSLSVAVPEKSAAEVMSSVPTRRVAPKFPNREIS